MSLTQVQSTFYDTPGALYPGQLADLASLALTREIRSYIAEDSVYAGRGCVKGANVAQDDHMLTPFAVKHPLAGSVLADVVGIVVRREANDAVGASDEASNRKSKTMVAVASLGSGALIGAEVPAGITVAHGDPVYMSVSHATIPVGKFSNAAAAGLIAITGATWYGAAAAGTIGRIKL